MPQQTFDIHEFQEETLERVRQQEGLETRDQAAELLVKRRLRRGGFELTGRGRALYPIQGGSR
ncbi:MAG: hypothetical protein CMN25_08405 [Salinicola sp.]|uniref:Uncharacterized protein n=1 Tax=Salinicola acroporae TaxID=1541440 RepID=A0ABT6I1M1_9GAMM|nr:hypothetical protein [Salinicola acroporae]MAM57340.1 hypothetical protein [Salinicola sp.]MDH4571125.1 hypothetical protein [Salinicola acroporae]|tara:strand:- start:679 stop:867 length:189 start_codon:yes stop_codon:yes gene_type:complete